MIRCRLIRCRLIRCRLIRCRFLHRCRHCAHFYFLCFLHLVFLCGRIRNNHSTDRSRRTRPCTRCATRSVTTRPSARRWIGNNQQIIILDETEPQTRLNRYPIEEFLATRLFTREQFVVGGPFGFERRIGIATTHGEIGIVDGRTVEESRVGIE